MSHIYDCIIIGGGPAGYGAAVYTTRLKMKTLLLDNKEQPSQVSWAAEVEDYLGFGKIKGPELLNKMKEHAMRFGLEMKAEKVVGLKNKAKLKTVMTQKTSYQAKTVIIATGSVHRHAGIKGEEKFIGKGVSYCASCDGWFFKGKKVIVVGGGDTALTYATYLKELGCDVTLVHRRKEFRAAGINVENAKKAGVKFVLERTIKEIKGDKMVKGVVLDNGEKIKTSAVFIAVGEVPSVEILKKAGIQTDKGNYIIVDAEQSTNMEGIFAAGSVTINYPRLIITAAAEGCRAAFGAYNYLKK
ncbi:MAG: NAD(P)/FAD-dependent oxidoreductase [Candidatus Aenigmatarchaeota archaeon]